MSDPYTVLGVTPEADDAFIRDAYLAAIKACPPDRDPRRFQAVRHAYEAIRTRKDRLAHELFDTTPPGVPELLDRMAPVTAPGRPARDLFEALLRGED